MATTTLRLKSEELDLRRLKALDIFLMHSVDLGLRSKSVGASSSSVRPR